MEGTLPLTVIAMDSGSSVFTVCASKDADTISLRPSLTHKEQKCAKLDGFAAAESILLTTAVTQ